MKKQKWQEMKKMIVENCGNYYELGIELAKNDPEYLKELSKGIKEVSGFEASIDFEIGLADKNNRQVKLSKR